MKLSIKFLAMTCILLTSLVSLLTAQDLPAGSMTVAPVASPTPLSPGFDRIYVGVGGGYGGVSLAEVERYVEMLVRSAREDFEWWLSVLGSGTLGTPIARMEEVTGGAFLMTEAGYRITPRISAGVRFFRYFIPDITGLFEENGSKGEYKRAEYKMTTGLTKFFLGGSVEKAFSGEDLLFRVSAYGGPIRLSSDVSASVVERYSEDENGAVSYVNNFPLSGSSFGMDFGMEVEYKFLGALGIYGEAGYSLANIPEMKVRKDTVVGVDKEPYPKGSIFRNEFDNEIVECDMGGIRVGAGVRARF